MRHRTSERIDMIETETPRNRQPYIGWDYLAEKERSALFPQAGLDVNMKNTLSM